jgi:hypothetical protein
MAKQPEACELHVIEVFQEIMPLTVPRHTDPVTTFQPLEDPASGWRGCGLSDGVGHGLRVLGSWLAKAALRHGVDQSRQGHHHEPPVNPVGLFDTPRRDEPPRVFEQP